MCMPIQTWGLHVCQKKKKYMYIRIKITCSCVLSLTFAQLFLKIISTPFVCHRYTSMRTLGIANITMNMSECVCCPVNLLSQYPLQSSDLLHVDFPLGCNIWRLCYMYICRHQLSHKCCRTWEMCRCMETLAGLELHHQEH